MATTIPKRVAICICTFRRPKMLDRCLRSIAAQVISSDIELSVIVVDNEAEQNNLPVVVRVAASCPFPVHYRHQPKRGIAAARNAALDEALKLEADWIAFIDDDEFAAPEWIVALMAPEYLDTPILQGHVEWIPDSTGPMPFWTPAWLFTAKRNARPREEGRRLKTSFTGNVRFSSELVRRGLHFDEGLGLGGGEDSQFFAQAVAAGFEIRHTFRAVTRETAHRERYTYLAQCRRAYWCAASDLRVVAVRRGWWKTITRKAHTVPLNIISGAFGVVISPLFCVAGLDTFKRRALAGGKKIAKGLGRGAAIVGRIPQPYANVVGN